MPLQFKPKTQEEIDADGLMPKGEYPATILLCEEAISKSARAAAEKAGTEPAPNMFKVKVGVYPSDGDRQQWITDYIMSDSPRLKQFADACKLGEDYKLGTLAAEQFDGRDVMVKVGIEKPRPKDKDDPNGEKWPPKNRIDAYVVEKPKDAVAETDDNDDASIDDIPF